MKCFVSGERFFQTEEDRPDCLMLVSLDVYGTKGKPWRYAGFEILQEMRRRWGREPLILMMAEDGAISAINACRSNGANGVIFKDRSVKKIIKQIEGALFASPQRALAATSAGLGLAASI